MVTGSATLTTSTSVLSDAVLVERIAALGDRAALAELDARHGMTLYAIAYTLLLNPDAADVAVATTLREVWRRAGSFNAREQTVGRWLADLTRKAARDQARRSARSTGGLPTGRTSVAPPPVPNPQRSAQWAPASFRLACVAAALVLPLIFLT